MSFYQVLDIDGTRVLINLREVVDVREVENVRSSPHCDVHLSNGDVIAVNGDLDYLQDILERANETGPATSA